MWSFLKTSDIEVTSDSAVWRVGVQLRKTKTSTSCQGRKTCDADTSIHGELVMIVIKWKQDQENKSSPLIESVNGLCPPLIESVNGLGSPSDQSVNGLGSHPDWECEWAGALWQDPEVPLCTQQAVVAFAVEKREWVGGPHIWKAYSWDAGMLWNYLKGASYNSVNIGFIK